MSDNDQLKDIDNIDKQIKELKAKRHVAANNTPKEEFDFKKLRMGLFSIFNPVLWIKDFCSIFNARKIVIYLLVFALFFGSGYLRAWKKKPIMVDCKDFNIETTTKDTLKKGETLRLWTKQGRMYYQFVHKDGSTSKERPVRQEDMPDLKPYGIHFKPKAFLGIGADGAAIGVGTEFAYLWKLNFDLFGMSDKTAYVGVSYDLDVRGVMENSATGLAIGKNIENTNDTTLLWYWSLKF